MHDNDTIWCWSQVLSIQPQSLHDLSIFHCWSCPAKDPNVRKLFHLVKQLKKKSHLEKYQVQPAEASPDSDPEEDEECDDGEGSESESEIEPSTDNHRAGKAEPKMKKSLPSSGSGRTKERARTDLLKVEIEELQNELQYHDICFI